jgi:hypothetical protein
VRKRKGLRRPGGVAESGRAAGDRGKAVKSKARC